MSILRATTLIDAPVNRVFDLARSIDLELQAAAALKIEAIGEITSGLIERGQQVCWRAKNFGVWVEHASKITEYQPPEFFQDTMIRGIFRFFQHDHFFRQLSTAATEMKDEVRFSAPLWAAGVFGDFLVVRPRLKRLLADRNQLIKAAAEATS